MLQPIERPPPSRQPRLAASMIPGPPPVMIAKPLSARRRAMVRASSYAGVPSSTRAEPKIVTAGPIAGERVEALDELGLGSGGRATGRCR